MMLVGKEGLSRVSSCAGGYLGGGLRLAKGSTTVDQHLGGSD
jgi:hypothetical protein